MKSKFRDYEYARSIFQQEKIWKKGPPVTIHSTGQKSRILLAGDNNTHYPVIVSVLSGLVRVTIHEPNDKQEIVYQCTLPKSAGLPEKRSIDYLVAWLDKTFKVLYPPNGESILRSFSDMINYIICSHFQGAEQYDTRSFILNVGNFTLPEEVKLPNIVFKYPSGAGDSSNKDVIFLEISTQGQDIVKSVILHPEIAQYIYPKIEKLVSHRSGRPEPAVIREFLNPDMSSHHKMKIERQVNEISKQKR